VKIVATSKAEQNEALIDPWTVVHVGFGLAAGLMGLNFYWSMAGATAYELIEPHLERTEAGQKFFNTSGPEHIGNAITDLGVFALGWYLGDKWNET
jgi:hypothetical protein